MAKEKAFNPKPGTFFGSVYTRGGKMKDKHGNTHYEPITFRNVHNPNVILSSKGKIIGGEKNREHEYGNKPHPLPVKYKRLQSNQEKAMFANIKRYR